MRSSLELTGCAQKLNQKFTLKLVTWSIFSPRICKANWSAVIACFICGCLMLG